MTSRRQDARDAAKDDGETGGRDLVVMLDGTGNELGRNLSNVLKLFRIVEKDDGQRIFYNPGVGTIGKPGRWRRFRQNWSKVFGLATGWGLDGNILEAYGWLCRNWKPGDRIWLFGFSRGAWTARVLGGFIHMIGLLRPDQLNLCGYALVAYKKAAENDDLPIAWHFSRVSASRRATIHFMGVWDTVGSVIVPRKDRLIPSLESLPYTMQNPAVRSFRHAMAIDERRRMFRVARWKRGQKYVENPFSTGQRPDQDAIEMWFAGVHSDVGGGYPEEESGLSKYPLIWMVDEASDAGLRIDQTMFDHLVKGEDREGNKHKYTPPNAAADAHNSLSWAWRLLEWVPKKSTNSETRKWSFLGLYIPWGERRRIVANDEIHASVNDRMEAREDYDPPNLKDREPAGKLEEDGSTQMEE